MASFLDTLMEERALMGRVPASGVRRVYGMAPTKEEVTRMYGTFPTRSEVAPKTNLEDLVQRVYGPYYTQSELRDLTSYLYDKTYGSISTDEERKRLLKALGF